MKLIKSFTYILILLSFSAFAQQDSLISNTIENVTQNTSIEPENAEDTIQSADSNLLNLQHSKPVGTSEKKSFETNYNAVDSNRMKNPFLFYNSDRDSSSVNIAEERIDAKNSNYYYTIFLLFVIVIITFSRVYPLKFRLQNGALFNRSDYSELLSDFDSWAQPSNIFPFAAIVLFTSVWIILPLLNYFSVEEFTVSILIISILVLVLIFSILRMSITIFSEILDFQEIANIFKTTSLNTVYLSSLVGFPILIILLSVFKINIFVEARNVLIIILILYSLRTLRTLYYSTRSNQRQIIYLIIYLCTLEIPLLLTALKWVKEYT